MTILRPETRTVLFADVSGMDRLYDRLGDTMAAEKLGRWMAALSEVIARERGEVIKTVGERIMGTFSAPEDAMAASAALQDRIKEEVRSVHVDAVDLRVGFHSGPVMVQEGDVFGDSVNVAARLVELANPGQILTSGETVSQCSTLWCSTRHLGPFSIRGKQNKISVHEVLTRRRGNDLDLTLMAPNTLALNQPRAFLRLRLGTTKVLLARENGEISLGRDPANDLVVEDQLASRLHARIRRSANKFVLHDQSTNGTFVFTSGGEITFIHRETLFLHGEGQISLGRKFAGHPEKRIQFECGTPRVPDRF